MDSEFESKDFSLPSDQQNNIIDSFNAKLKTDRNITEEEFQNFMHRVTEVEKIVKQLASTDIKEQEYGMLLADKILENNNGKADISENSEVKIKTDRSMINKYVAEDSDPNKMSQEAFMRSVEQDAKSRAEDRKARNERAETYKRIGIAAFREANYEKAITYFGKSLEQRRDSAVLWNNRALAYMQLGLHEKALGDCEWALKVNEANIKALLNSAKCHKALGDQRKCREFIELARERNPKFRSYIAEFEKSLDVKADLQREAMDNSID